MIKLAIVDDHQIVIDGIRSLLHGNPDFQVVAEATLPSEMLELLSQVEVDIVLTDVLMPVMNGAQFSRELKRSFPKIKILALSMSGQGAIVNQMMKEANISGYILKNSGQKILIAALKEIAGGGSYFSEEVGAEMQRDQTRVNEMERANITRREVEIIRLIEREMSNKQIAAQLFLSEKTVETHRKNIFRKTKTTSLIGLIKYAYEHKII